MIFAGKKIAVIGASYLQLPLVLKAKELGMEVFCFAWEEGAVCRDIADHFYPISIIEKDKILEVCRENRIDGITSIASDVAVPTINYVATRLNLCGNSDESGYLATNKYAMRKTFHAGGLNCPAFRKIRNYEEAEDALKEIGCPVIVKPCDRSGSLAVTMVNTPEMLSSAVDSALSSSFCKEAVLEKFVDVAQEISIEGISWKGDYHLLAITDKVTTGIPHFVEVGHHQPSQLTRAILENAVRQAELGVKLLGIEYGASHSEFMISKSNEVYVTEIGSRMGGAFIGSDLVNLSTGYDFLKGVIEVSLGEFSGIEFGERQYAGVWFYTPETTQVKEISEHKPKYPWIIRSEIHDLKPLTCNADRAGYFIYRSNGRINLF